MRIFKRVANVLFFLLVIQTGTCSIISPRNPLICVVGEKALFNWTTDDGRKIFSVNWGIKNGNSPDSQFINTNVYTNIINYNKNMNPKYKGRVSFIGNLTIGRAWFLLKNVTLSDGKKYVANIYENKAGVLPYIVQLKVNERAYVSVTTKMMSTYTTKAPTTSVRTSAWHTNHLNDSVAATNARTAKVGMNQPYGLIAAFLFCAVSLACTFLVYWMKSMFKEQYFVCKV